MFFGAVFGLISAVAIYHLLMYAVLRVPEFLSYGAYLAALAIFQLGREPQYLAVLGIGVDGNTLFWLSFALLDEVREDDGSVSGAWLSLGPRPLELVYGRDRALGQHRATARL